MPIDNRISAMQYLESRKDEVIPALQLLIKMYDEIEDINNNKVYIADIKNDASQIYRKSYVSLLELNPSQYDKDGMKEEFEGWVEAIDEILNNSRSIIEQNIPSFTLDTTSMDRFMTSLNEGNIQTLAYSVEIQKIAKQLKTTIKGLVKAMLNSINELTGENEVSLQKWIAYLNAPQE